MKLSSSIWIWIYISIVCIGKNKVEAYEEAFKEALLTEFREALLGDFKEALLDDVQAMIDTKMDLVNNRFDQSERAMTIITGSVQAMIDTKMDLVHNRFDQSERAMTIMLDDLVLITGSVQAIEGEVSAITGRSSESQLNIRDVKDMQINMSNQMVNLKEKVNIIDESLNEMIGEYLEGNNETFAKIISIGNETQLQLQDISESLQVTKEVLQIINNDTTEFIEKISEELKQT